MATGTTLKIIADAVANDRAVIGFDTFTGLPEAWRTGFPVGEFAQSEVPKVVGAELIVGLFEDELPAFLARTEEQIAFLHVDCDLYSSTKTVLVFLLFSSFLFFFLFFFFLFIFLFCCVFFFFSFFLFFFLFFLAVFFVFTACFDFFWGFFVAVFLLFVGVFVFFCLAGVFGCDEFLGDLSLLVV